MIPSTRKAGTPAPARHRALLGVAVLVFCSLLAIAYTAIAVQSGVRAYVAGEGQWSKSEKDAFIYLARYAEAGAAEDYERFRQELAVPLGDRDARLAMLKPTLDRTAATRGLTAGRNAPADIPLMIRLFRYGGRLPYMSEAIGIWTEADPSIEELSRIGEAMQAAYAAPRPAAGVVHALYLRAFDINARLRPLEDRFSGALAEGALSINKLLLTVVALGALVVLGLGFAVVKRLLDGMHVSEALFRDTFEQAAVGICHVAPDGRVLRVNQRCCEITGLPREALVGRAFGSIVEAQDALEAELHDARVLNGQDWIRVAKRRLRREDGREVWARITTSLVRGEAGRPDYFLNVIEDVSSEQGLTEQLSYQASHDAVTGLANRFEFEKRITAALRRVEDGAPDGALCYLDLDQFKIINDTLGHVAGDELLRQLAQELGVRLRSGDTLARLGGDEFGVLLEGCHVHAASVIAEALRRSVDNKRFLWQGREYRVGVSIGVVPIDRKTSSVQQLLSDADEACYAAKDRGRNLVQVHQPDSEQTARRHVEMQWITRLREALTGEGLSLVYQTIQPLAPVPGQGEHFEVLLRMHQRDGVPVPPGSFLAVAERYNLGSKVDEWVVEAALSWLAAHREVLGHIGLCSINLSAQSLGNARFLEFLEGEIRRYAVPPHLLCFEITETTAVSDIAAAGRFIGALRDMGCRFSLDDFGSGMSSFAYLRSLPVDFLKIDGAFIRGMAADPVNRAVVASINEISHTLGKRTIGEFVEDAATLQAAREVGLDYAQGYGIAKPRPISELLSLARRRPAPELTSVPTYTPDSVWP
ncbi:MAG TPA: EAL domain-containing protein [Gammaproteobacteria bacterium]|nr:EAL domain-containing protein [Gammaproteobacteria bacterium]